MPCAAAAGSQACPVVITALSIVAIQREASELAEVRQVAAVPLVFQHVAHAAEVVSRVGGRRFGAYHDELQAKGLAGKIDCGASPPSLVAGRLQECHHALGMTCPDASIDFASFFAGG
jgi:hypothetical protein